MINLSQLAHLRLGNFISREKITSYNDWEYEDRIWQCDTYGFTQFCRDLKTGDLGAISIDLKDFEHDIADSIFETINAPLSAKIDFNEIREILGSPTKTCGYTPDRETHEYNNLYEQNINVGVTVLKNGEFIYFTLLCNA